LPSFRRRESEERSYRRGFPGDTFNDAAPLRGDGDFFAVKHRKGFEALKTLPALRFNFIITDINSLKLISFVKSSSSYSMQAVVE
jgi:hypothetical protein